MEFDGWSLLILAGTLLFSASLVPQVVRTLRIGRAEHISALFIVLVLVASACNLIYFIHLKEWIAASGFLVNLAAWGTVLQYRLKPRPKDEGLE